MSCYYDETVIETVTIDSPTVHIGRDTQPRFRI
jgi:hypothetical protein